jgi:AAA domain
MSLSDRIKTSTTKEGKIIVDYSAPGVGKTSKWCQASNAVLVEIKDNSASALKEIGSIRADLPVISTTGWNDSLDILKSLVNDEHPYKNIVIDGLSGLDEYCNEITIAEDCGGDSDKFLAFGRGEGLASIKWMELVQILRDLKSKGFWVYLLAHQQVVTINDPSGSNYVKYSPAVGKGKLAQTMKYSDAIFFSTFIVATKDVNKESGKGKAVGGERRVMYCTPGAAWEAKNRLGIPGIIELGNSPEQSFSAFAQAVKAGKIQK